MSKKLISVITPTRNEEANVARCHAAVAKVFAELLPEYDHEHIFADNGSADQTRDLLRELAGKDKKVRVILNSRNFGAESSMFNALLTTRGDAVMVMIPADLQDPPELLPRFVELWENGEKIVYGIRRHREGSRLMTAARRVFYRIVARVSDIAIPVDVGEYQLIDRVVVDALRRFDDRRPYLRGMIASCGFKAIGIEYDVARRVGGRSNLSLYRLVDIALNGLTSFSAAPLRVALFAGMALAGVSVIYSLINLFITLIWFRAFAEPGIATLIVALFFFGGVQLFFIGVIGEYIIGIHTQVRGHPLVIEEERINFGEDTIDADDG